MAELLTGDRVRDQADRPTHYVEVHAHRRPRLGLGPSRGGSRRPASLPTGREDHRHRRGRTTDIPRIRCETSDQMFSAVVSRGDTEDVYLLACFRQWRLTELSQSPLARTRGMRRTWPRTRTRGAHLRRSPWKIRRPPDQTSGPFEWRAAEPVDGPTVYRLAMDRPGGRRFGASWEAYDLRFLEVVRPMALKGADLVCVPTAC